MTRGVGLRIVVLLALVVALVIRLLPAPTRPSDLVARLPGVGYGWLDTLQRVAGPAQLDTISPLETFDECCDLLGLFERWHVIISVQPHMTAYARFVRHSTDEWCDAPRGWFGPSYRHPLAMANPAGVTAHEFGHRFQFGLRPHTVPVKGDTLPRWARDDSEERFADRFARAMLALRGWDEPDTTDQVLNHRVRYLLMKSYWPASAPVTPRPATPADGTSTHRAKKPKQVFTTHHDF